MKIRGLKRNYTRQQLDEILEGYGKLEDGWGEERDDGFTTLAPTEENLNRAKEQLEELDKIGVLPSEISLRCYGAINFEFLTGKRDCADITFFREENGSGGGTLAMVYGKLFKTWQLNQDNRYRLTNGIVFVLNELRISVQINPKKKVHR